MDRGSTSTSGGSGASDVWHASVHHADSAANAGDGHAALRLGETYDPAFLARTRFIGARENASVAAYWYQRAGELGVPEGEILLSALVAETRHRVPK